MTGEQHHETRQKLHEAIEEIVRYSDDLLAGFNGKLNSEQMEDIVRVRECANSLIQAWSNAPDPSMLDIEQRRAIGHGLKNMLNGVTGYTLMLLDNMVGELTPPQRVVITDIYENGMLLLDAISRQYSGINFL